MYRNRLQNRSALLESGMNIAYLLGTERGRSLLGLDKIIKPAITTPEMIPETLNAPALGSPALGAELSYSPGLMNMAGALGPEIGAGGASMFATPALTAPAAASYSLTGVPAIIGNAALMSEAAALPTATAPSALSAIGTGAMAGGIGATAGKFIGGALGGDKTTKRISGVLGGAGAGFAFGGPVGGIIGGILGIF